MRDDSAGHAASIRHLHGPTPTPMEAAPSTVRPTGRLLEDSVITSGKKEIDKKSLDYIVKTGVAGGFAGCAVSWTSCRKLLDGLTV